MAQIFEEVTDPKGSADWRENTPRSLWWLRPYRGEERSPFQTSSLFCEKLGHGHVKGCGDLPNIDQRRLRSPRSIPPRYVQ
jgi:hypothetical protein